ALHDCATPSASDLLDNPRNHPDGVASTCCHWGHSLSDVHEWGGGDCASSRFLHWEQMGHARDCSCLDRGPSRGCVRSPLHEVASPTRTACVDLFPRSVACSVRVPYNGGYDRFSTRSEAGTCGHRHRA